MSAEPEGPTIGYIELAQRIEDSLGVVVPTSTLRAEGAHARQRAVRRTRPRITTGMPAPLPAPRSNAPARFDLFAVEQWLAHHPRLLERAAENAFTARLAAAEDRAGREQAVHLARMDHLSWRQITALLNAHEQRTRALSAVVKMYAHLSTGDPDHRHLD